MATMLFVMGLLVIAMYVRSEIGDLRKRVGEVNKLLDEAGRRIAVLERAITQGGVSQGAEAARPAAESVRAHLAGAVVDVSPDVRTGEPAAEPVPAEPVPAEPQPDKAIPRKPAPIKALPSKSAPVKAASMAEARAATGDVPLKKERRASAVLPGLPRRADLEEQLGARLPVWIGSIALLLAGVYLVKFTFDEGILSPPVRVALGAVLGVLLLGGAERMRSGSPRVASGLAASGVGVLFASFLAATNVFMLVTPLVGFALMALTTATAVALSLRHGMLVAILGLVGGFMTPYLIRTGAEPDAAALFAYLLILQIGLLVVTRRRGWWHLAGVTLVAGMLWVVLWLAGSFVPTDDVWIGLFLLSSTATFIVSALYGDSGATWGDGRVPPILVRAAIGGSLLLLAAVTISAGFRSFDWAFLALIGGGCIVLGRLDRRFVELPWITATATGLLLALWPLQEQFSEAIAAFPQPEGPPVFLWTVLALGALYAIGGYAALWGSGRPAVWAALASISAVAYLLVAYFGATSIGLEFPWGIISFGLGVVAVGSAVPVARKRFSLENGNLALAAFAAAATMFIALAIAFELPSDWMPAAWALQAAALAWIAHRLRVPQMRALVWPVAALVGARLLLNPNVLDYPIGELPILNWYLYGYGVPIVALAYAAWISLVDGDERLSRALQWVTLFLGLAFITLQIRQVFQPGDPTAGDMGFVERGTYIVAWMSYAITLMWVHRRLGLQSFRLFAEGLAAVSLAGAIVFNLLTLNHLVMDETVGRLPLLNWLLWVYGVPAVLAAALALLLEEGDKGRRARSNLAWIAGLTLLLGLLTFQVEHLFHRSVVPWTGPVFVEIGTLLAVWLAYALVLLRSGAYLGRSVFESYGWLVTALATVLSLVAALGANPVFTGDSAGRLPLLNGLLWAYGAPAVLLLAIAWDRRSNPADLAFRVPAALASALVLFLALITLQVRHWFHGAELSGFEVGFVEGGTYVIAWLLLALGLLKSERWWPIRVLAGFGGALAAGALGVVLVVGLLALNPVFSHQEVGNLPVLNWLLWVYGVPAALALLISKELRENHPVSPWVAALPGLAALLLTFGLVTLEVRQLFHGAILDGPTSASERYSYSLAWILFGTALLLGGIVTRTQLARYASLAVMFIAVAKVFLYDTGNLGDLYRVFSYLGLGLSLLLLAWLYQRFVFVEVKT